MAPTYARFLLGWHGIGGGRGGIERLAEVIAQLEGLPLPASVLEREILPARVPGYLPRLLDELGAAGEVCWVGQGSLGRDDGRVALYRPDRLALLMPATPDRLGRGRGVAAGRPARRARAARRELLSRSAGHRRGRGKGRGAPGARSARSAGRPLDPRLGGRRDQRHLRAAPGPPLGPPWRHRRGAAIAASPGSGRRRPPAAGRSSLTPASAPFRSPGASRRRPSIVTHWRCASSNARASSPATASRRRRWPAASAPSTRSSANSRSAGASVEATSWKGSAGLSSPRPVPSTGCARYGAASPATTAACGPWSWRRPTRPTHTGRRCPGHDGGTRTAGRSSAPPGRASSSSMAHPSWSWSEAGARCSPSRRRTIARPWGRLSEPWRRVSPTAARAAIEIQRVDGLPVASSAIADALGEVGFRASYRGWVLRAQGTR